MSSIKEKKKILLISLIIVLLTCTIYLIYLLIKVDNLKNINQEITKELSMVRNNISTINEENKNNELNLEIKKTELKGKIKEYNIWLEMIEKLK